MSVLFIDACPRQTSRTRALAETVLNCLDGNVIRVNLNDTKLQEIGEIEIVKRDKDARNHDFSDPVYHLAKQFAEADAIVIAAPYWDLSFPAILKKYIEQIMVSGITFRYSEEGFPVGLCKAEKLFYVTTSGGPVINDELGYGYVRTLAQVMFGISECCCFKAENLDIIGVNVEAVLDEAEKQVAAYFKEVFE